MVNCCDRLEWDWCSTRQVVLQDLNERRTVRIKATDRNRPRARIGLTSDGISPRLLVEEMKASLHSEGEKTSNRAQRGKYYMAITAYLFKTYVNDNREMTWLVQRFIDFQSDYLVS
jgi:hypothetical protein